MVRIRRKTKIFILYSISIIIPLTAICAILYSISLSKEEKAYMRTHEENIHLLASRTDYMLSTYENMSFQVAASPVLNSILSSEDEISNLTYFELGNELNKFIYSQSIIYSMYVYFKPQYTVFTTTEGKMSPEGFYDRDILTPADPSVNKDRLIPRIISNKSYFNKKPVSVISIIRDIPIAASYSLGRLIINLDEEILSKEMYYYSMPGGTVFLLDSKNSAAIGKRQLDNSFSAEELGNIVQKIDGISDSKLVKINGNAFFLAYAKSQFGNWKYISLVPYNTIADNINNLKTTILRFFLIIALIGLACGFFFQEYIYSPFKKLVLIAGDYIKSLGGIEQKTDEVSVVSKTMQSLVNENSVFKSLVKQHAPIVREKLVFDLLSDNILTDQELQDRLEYSGLVFKYNAYVAVIAAIIYNLEYEDRKMMVEYKIYAGNVVEQEFLNEGMIAVSTLMEEDNIAFILNFDSASNDILPRDRLEIICNRINTILYEKIGVKIFFVFGTMQNSLKSLSDSFIHAKKDMKYKALSDSAFAIFASQEGLEPDYPIAIHREIINGIKACNRDTIRAAVEKLFSEYIKDTSYSPKKLRLVLIVFYSSICGEVIKENGSMGSLREENFEHFLECSDIDKLRQYMEDSFIDIIAAQENSMERLSNDTIYITAVLKYMEDNYQRDISLADISSCVNLNPRYLAKIFKNLTGKTIFEYLNQYRIKMSKGLIGDITLSIKDIGKMVGFNDVHSFIKHFKKYEGITPGEFRTLSHNT